MHVLMDSLVMLWRIIVDINPDLVTDERGFTVGGSKSSVSEFEEGEGTTESPENDKFIMISESEFIGV